MGFVDTRLLLSSNQNVIATAIVESTNTIDLQSLRDIGHGNPLYIRFTVTEAFTADNGAPMLYTGVNTSPVGGAGWALNARTETHALSGGTGLEVIAPLAVPVGLQAAALTLGRTWYMPIPPFHVSDFAFPLGQRYLGCSYWQFGYETGVRDFATGKITADVVDSTHLPQRLYPQGFDE
jgi:hypothetical protein